MRQIEVLAAAGLITLQDRGRPGLLAQGLSRGGAADPVALAEGAALLSQSLDCAAIEMMGASVRLRFSNPARIALTGAPMRAGAELPDGQTSTLSWQGSHALPAGTILTLQTGSQGGFGYLHLGGGVASPPVMGARGAHLAGGVGRLLHAGDSLPLDDDPGQTADLLLDPLPRFDGGDLRALPSLQTPLYGKAQIARLQDTDFSRDSHGNRMGVRLDLAGAPPFAAPGGLSIVSEIVQPGDLQITGDGTPFVLMAECQTMGGYPRIATILPCDLPIVAQAPPGAPLRIRMISRDEAITAMRIAEEALTGLRKRIRTRRRDPAQMGDLLGYNLIGGMVDASRPDHIEHHIHDHNSDEAE